MSPTAPVPCSRRRFVGALLPTVVGAWMDSDHLTPRGEVVRDGVRCRWRHDRDRLVVTLEAPTVGWIAAGFSPTHELRGTRFVIGAPSVDPFAAEEHIALVPNHEAVQRLGATASLTIIGGRSLAGRSTLEWSLPHQTPAPWPLTLTPATHVWLMLAWSMSTDFTHHSAWRRHIEVVL